MHRFKRGKIPDEVLRLLLLESRGICCLCHKSSIENIHHLREVSKGGTNVGSNLAGVCATCHHRIHEGPDQQTSLLAARNEWLLTCHTLLADIIQADVPLEPRARRIYQEYFGLRDPEQLREFTGRLRGFLGAGVLFDNFVNIRQHSIRKTVDVDGNCWTYEEQRFRPLTTLSKRNVQFSGACAVAFQDTQFRVELNLNGDWQVPQWKVVHDAPQGKIVSVQLPRILLPSDYCICRFSYYWPRTWDFMDDLYTYDVLTWIERISYEFSLPAEFAIESVATEAIDLFGHLWLRKDKVSMTDNAFSCVSGRLPPFTSWRIRYTARRAATV